MKVLIIGGSGLLGSNLSFYLSNKFDVLSTYNKHKFETKKFKFTKLNIENYTEIKNLVKDYKPNYIIHTAAVSRPEIAEKMSDDELSKINIQPCEYLSDLSNKINARLFFTSTDLVYEQSDDEIYEHSKLLPLSKYAKSKLEGENVISSISKNYVILRVALLLGFSYSEQITSNFHKNYISFKNNEKANLFIDQIRTPLSVLEASRILETLFKSDLQNDVINFCGKDFVTRYEIGEILCRVMKKRKDMLNPIELAKIDAENKIYKLKLNSDKLNLIFKNRLDIEKSIQELVKDYEENYNIYINR